MASVGTRPGDENNLGVAFFRKRTPLPVKLFGVKQNTSFEFKHVMWGLGAVLGIVLSVVLGAVWGALHVAVECCRSAV